MLVTNKLLFVDSAPPPEFFKVAIDVTGTLAANVAALLGQAGILPAVRHVASGGSERGDTGWPGRYWSDRRLFGRAAEECHLVRYFSALVVRKETDYSTFVS